MTQEASASGPPGRPGGPDLLDVSAVAPTINAGPPDPDDLSRRGEGPALLPVGRASLPAGDGVGRAGMPAPPPVLARPPGDRGDPAETSGYLGAGLMGPTPPVATEAASTPPAIPEAGPATPIDLSSALRLADGQNPVIGEARTLILAALAERQAARAILLPDLHAGSSYHDHTGPLQRGSGAILPETQQNAYVGGGAFAVGAGPASIPAVNINSPLAEAIYRPLAARQRVAGARLNASDTANKVLLDVASLYIELIGAEATLEARRVTAAEADRIAASVRSFAENGQGRRSDAERADAGRRLFQVDIQRAEEAVAVASARLAERLNLDPSSPLRPVAGALEPIDLIDPETPPEDLIRDAVARRPDLAARRALVAAAQYLVRQEKARPLLPTVWLAFSGGAFGGGSNLVADPLGSFAGRTDFDVRAYWTVLNLGAGNASLIKQRRAEAGQAMAERARVLNQVRDEVAAARARSLALRAEVANARVGLRTSEDGYRQDQARLRESLSRPIEALDSLRLLSDARIALIRAITRANQSQFALFVALGSPPPLGPG